MTKIRDTPIEDCFCFLCKEKTINLINLKKFGIDGKGCRNCYGIFYYRQENGLPLVGKLTKIAVKYCKKCHEIKKCRYVTKTGFLCSECLNSINTIKIIQ